VAAAREADAPTKEESAKDGPTDEDLESEGRFAY
jgi:hypothetical protein